MKHYFVRCAAASAALLMAMQALPLSVAFGAAPPLQDASVSSPQQTQAPQAEDLVDADFAAPTDLPVAQTQLMQESDATQNLSGLYVHEQAFSTDYSLTGLFAQCSEGFLAGDWDVKNATLLLRFSVTQIVEQTLSSITVSLNGTPFYSARIGQSLDGQMQELAIMVPQKSIQEGTNTITIQTYVRTQDSLPCVDDVADANWLNVSADSLVTLHYLPKAQVATVAQLYQQLTSIDALENNESTVLVRAQATQDEFTAAALALSGIAGNAAAFYSNLGFAQVTEEGLFASKYELFVCQYDKLPDTVTAQLSVEQVAAAQEGALLAVVGSGHSSMLLVTAADTQALLQAARMLGNRDLMQQTRTSWRSVRPDDVVLAPASQQTQYSTLDTYGRKLTGPFHQVTSYAVELSSSRKLAASSELRLFFRYSENLDFDRSLVTASINGVPIGSQKLQKEKAQADTAVFTLPTDLRINGNFTVELAFDLEIKDLWCTLRQSDTPWAFVAPESALKLSTMENNSILFDTYPSPFVTDGSLNNVVVLLPDAPSTQDFLAFSGIMTTLGRYLKDNRGQLSVRSMSDAGELSQANIIAIGAVAQNEMVRKHADKLYFRFDETGTTLVSNEKMAIAPAYGATLGTVQLLASPYTAEHRALMVVTGATTQAMLQAAMYVCEVDKLWSVYGDGFVADGAQAFAFRFKEDNAPQPPTLAQLAQRPDLMLFGLAALLVFCLTALATGMLLIKYRRRKRDEI